MKMKIRVAFVPLLMVLAWSFPALAIHGKAGLWKETVTAQTSMQGVPADSNGKPSTGEYCRTVAEAKADAPAIVGRDCTQHNVKWIGGTVSGDTVCAPPVSGKGSFSETFTSDTHYVGGYAFNGTAPGGGAFRMTTHFTADWVSANCGTVKPLE
jgi:hypothetical protein